MPASARGTYPPSARGLEDTPRSPTCAVPILRAELTERIRKLDLRIAAGTPHEERARRLFRRMDELRQRIDYRQPGWEDPIEEALVAFRDEGTPPPEGLVGDWVYALAEYDCPWRHRKGEDVAERMATLDGMT